MANFDAMKLGQLADKLYLTRQKRYAVQRQVESFKVYEQELTDAIINELPKSEAQGVAGSVARVQIKSTEKPTVEDWDKVYKFILDTGNFQLLQRRLNVDAYKEVTEELSKELDGIKKITIKTLSLNKL